MGAPGTDFPAPRARSGAVPSPGQPPPPRPGGKVVVVVVWWCGGVGGGGGGAKCWKYDKSVGLPKRIAKMHILNTTSTFYDVYNVFGSEFH